MLLLTWHGTILRVEQAQSRLTQAAPVPVRDIALDFRAEFPMPLTAPAAIGAGIEAVPGDRPGTVHLRRDGLYLCATPAAAFLACDQRAPAAHGALLPLTEAEAATLRALLSGVWRAAGGSDMDRTGITLEPGFCLRVGEHGADLVQSRPATLADGTVRLALPHGVLSLAPGPAVAAPDEWRLRPDHTARIHPPVPSAAALHTTPDSRFVLPSAPERCYLPLTASRADMDWLYTGAPGVAPLAGTHHFYSNLIRQQNAWMLMDDCVAGTIFAAGGVCNDAPFLARPDMMLPACLAGEAGDVFFNTAALQGAPMLQGPHAVFYEGDTTSYQDWILNALVPLSAMHSFLPPETTLLLPAPCGSAGPARLAILEAFGFGDMKRVEIAVPVCQVQDLYWLDRARPCEVSAIALHAARSRAWATRPQPGPSKRGMFVADPGFVANADFIARRLRKDEFETGECAGLPIGEQIDLFASAGLIILAGPAAMANLLFCRPGTKVIELAAYSSVPRMAASLCSKLGLLHAIVPCPQAEDGGGLVVEIERLRAVLRMVQARL